MTDPSGLDNEPATAAEESLYARESSGVGLVVVLAIVALLVTVVIGGAGSPPGTSADRPATTAEAALPGPSATTTSTTTSTTSTSTSTTTTSTTTSTTSTSTSTTTTTVPAPVSVSVADIDAGVAGYLAARLPGWTITYLGPRPDITGWADPTSRILYVYVRPDRSVADHVAVIRHQIDVIAASGS